MELWDSMDLGRNRLRVELDFRGTEGPWLPWQQPETRDYGPRAVAISMYEGCSALCKTDICLLRRRQPPSHAN